MENIIEQNSDENHKDKIYNLALYLRNMADMKPYKKAVVYPCGRDKKGRVKYVHLTFQQLDRESDLIAQGLEDSGIKRGTRTILMVKPGLDFFSITFALIKTGAVPVMVDPGMGIGRMLNCLKEGRPEAFIGIPKAHILRTIFPKYFKTVKTYITVGKRWFWGGATLKELTKKVWYPYKIAKTLHDETAAIMFTTGSTGPAKGVVYTHGTFEAQVRQIHSHFEITTDEIDLPTFPLFAIFDPALGITAVIPDMDPTKPALVNPEKIIGAITDHGVTNMFASPALLNRVGRYGMDKGIRLPSLKRVISAGAPVLPANIKQFNTMLSVEAEIHTPYGATEAFPIISIKSSEILSETYKLSEKGFGTCIGVPINDYDVRLIEITDDPIEIWSDDLLVKQGEIGEITVKGELVTKKYFSRSDADSHAKVKDGDTVWHRMGDLGWMDKNGRIWFCGRKNHRVIISANNTAYTVPCEAIFNNHPGVLRSALVGIGPPGNQKPVICIERNAENKISKKKLGKELVEIAGQHMITKSIETILFPGTFPVDIRHNSKIFREKLAVWATKKIKDQ
ncbi:MAG: AMP-binding protein [Desulfobacteraceae bacterium]|nr:AMP-binding protein [Desulfobacteraceae bacterium]